MSVLEDGSSPSPKQDSAPAAGVSTSNSFTPPAGSLVAVIAVWEFGAPQAGATLTCADSLGNAYTAGPQQRDLDNGTISAIFTRAYASAPGSAITAKVTCSTTAGTPHCLNAPRVLTSCASSQAGAGTATGTGTLATAVQKSLTTTKAGSLVLLAAGASSNQALTAIASTTSFSAWNDGVTGDSAAAGKAAAVTGTPGATTFGWTAGAATDFGFAALEVLPAAATTPVSDTETASGSDAPAGTGEAAVRVVPVTAGQETASGSEAQAGSAPAAATVIRPVTGGQEISQLFDSEEASQSGPYERPDTTQDAFTGTDAEASVTHLVSDDDAGAVDPGTGEDASVLVPATFALSDTDYSTAWENPPGKTSPDSASVDPASGETAVHVP